MGDPTAAIGNNPMETTKQRLKHIVATLNQSRTDKKKVLNHVAFTVPDRLSR